MPSALEEGDGSPSHHIELVDNNPSPRHDGELSPVLRNSKGWDGKLRVTRHAVIANPDALEDPEYSDEDNVVAGEELEADEDLLENESPDTDEIACMNSRIQSISALRLDRFKKVKRLNLRQNHITRIEGLEPLAETLEDLELYDNLIKHIRGLDALVNLTNLDLSFNKLKHIKHIDHLSKLTDLFLVANEIGTIENLGGLTQLRNLELGDNKIRELRNLDQVPALQELWVAKNKITQLTGLGGLPNLRLLSIQSNRISSLAPLRDVPGLEELYISHNALASLEGLEHNARLRVLDVSNNQVAGLRGLGPLAQLEEFWASYNQIADFAEVERLLADKQHLTTVYFEGNPLQLRGPAVYHNKVRLALPQVKQIDATMVQEPRFSS